MPPPTTPASIVQAAGRRQHGASVKTLKRMLKKAGLKTSGKKAALTRRVKKAHLKMRGGAMACFSSNGDKNGKTETECTSPDTWKEEDPNAMQVEGGRRRRRGTRSRKH